MSTISQDQYNAENENLEYSEQIDQNNLIDQIDEEPKKKTRKSKTNTEFYVNNAELSIEIRKYQTTRSYL